MKNLPIYLVDDEEATRHSVGFLLKTSGFKIREFASGDALLTAARSLDPGVILLDVHMPEQDGLEVQRALNDAGILFPVIFMTGHGEVRVAVEAMKAGAVEFIEKPFNKQTILNAITQAHERYRQVERLDTAKTKALLRLNKLSAREREVLQCVARGLPSKTIGYDLGISPRTVEIHRAKIMKKLDVGSLPELLRLAFAAGLGRS